MLGIAVLFTWLYNGTRGSLLFPLLLHNVINASGAVWEAVPDAGSDAHQRLLITTAVWVAASVVIMVSGAERLSRRRRQLAGNGMLPPVIEPLGEVG